MCFLLPIKRILSQRSSQSQLAVNSHDVDNGYPNIREPLISQSFELEGSASTVSAITESVVVHTDNQDPLAGPSMPLTCTTTSVAVQNKDSDDNDDRIIDLNSPFELVSLII